MSKTAAAQPTEPIFDYIILEEASQAFLATIAACKLLARKLIIVGDPMQLEPIVQQPNPERIHRNINSIVTGLESYAYNAGCLSLQLTDTYRLTNQAAQQTGLFYQNALISKSSINIPVEINGKFSLLFDPQGGTSVYFIDMANEGRMPKTGVSLIEEIVRDIHNRHPAWEIAVLAPFVNTVKLLQEQLYPQHTGKDWLTVETIDRIQGLTCDLTIFLLPFGSSAFGMKPNRFNVATSRAKRGTLIIADLTSKIRNPATGKVGQFWDDALGATAHLPNHIAPVLFPRSPL